MHQNASECIEMHQNVWRMNNVNVLCMKFQFEKFWFFGQKMVIFLLSAQNASICIRMHQNVCRMNCANVLCMKLSKKLFLLHLNRLKLMNYLWLFVMEDPVVSIQKRKITHEKPGFYAIYFLWIRDFSANNNGTRYVVLSPIKSLSSKFLPDAPGMGSFLLTMNFF